MVSETVTLDLSAVVSETVTLGDVPDQLAATSDYDAMGVPVVESSKRLLLQGLED